MNEKSDLLKEAIADAKAVKETALANAKIALEEAFAPRIHNMLSTKLSEDLYEDEMDMDMDAEAEIEAPIEEPSVVVDGEKYVKADDEAEGAEIDVDMDAAPDMDMGEEPMNDDMAMEGGMMNDADEDPTDLDSGVEEDLELEAIIRELEEDLNEEELTEEELAEDAHNSDAADSTDSHGNDLMAEPKEMKNEEFNIDEIIEEILSEEDKEDEPKDKVEEGEHYDK